MVSALISTLIQVLIGWLVYAKLPSLLNLTGIIATIVKVIGILIIISAILNWV